MAEGERKWRQGRRREQPQNGSARDPSLSSSPTAMGGVPKRGLIPDLSVRLLRRHYLRHHLEEERVIFTYGLSPLLSGRGMAETLVEGRDSTVARGGRG